MDNPRFIIVGGDIAGLSAALKLLEKGFSVRIFSSERIRRSASVKIRDGIAAVPEISRLLVRLGVPFNRTQEGALEIVNGNLFAGKETGAQILYVLENQLRKFEPRKLISRFEFWRFGGVVKDNNGKCLGITATNMRMMDVRPFSADAVILNTGLFDRSEETPALFDTGDCSTLFSSITGGFRAAETALEYVLSLGEVSDADIGTFFENEVKRVSDWMKKLALQDGAENIFDLKRELYSTLKERVHYQGTNQMLESASEKLQELEERFKNCATLDKSRWANQEIIAKMDFCDKLNSAQSFILKVLNGSDTDWREVAKGVQEWLR